MKRIVGMMAAMALVVAGFSGVALAKRGGQWQDGPCGDRARHSAQAAGCERAGCDGEARGRECDGPRHDARQARMGRGCDGPCGDRKGGARGGECAGNGPCGEHRGDSAKGGAPATLTAEQAKAKAQEFVDSALKGASLKDVDGTPRGRRFPHYFGTVEQGGKLYGIAIDAGDGSVRGLRALRGTPAGR